MNEQKLNELSVMATAIADYLQKNGNPHQTVVITSEYFKLVSDDYFTPIVETAE